MQLVFEFTHALVRGTCAAVLLASAASAAQANWLTKLAREAGEAGTHAPRLGAGLERAASHIRALPATGGDRILAAHVTPEGHWKFVNREGEVFTAGNSAEMQRAVPTLLPEAGDGRLTFYLSEDSLFGERALLKELPEGAALRVVTKRDSYPLVAGAAGAQDLYAAVRPHLHVVLADRALFDEAVAQLERPLSRADIRTLALEPGGPAQLASAPRVDPATRAALVDAIDPPGLAGALASVRGQTVLVTGRIEGEVLRFLPASGSEQSLKLLDVIRAAQGSDVNLVILHAPSPRQPGGRNWLWQRITVGGLDDALKRATFGDFLDALGAKHGAFRIAVARDGAGRVVIRAVPESAAGEPITGVVGEWLEAAASSITGNVVTGAVEVHARDEARQSELDLRIIPWLPSDYQFAYILALVAGILGWPVARAWWARLWPSEERAEYTSATGYHAARTARFLAFLVLFLPIVGVPAFFVSLVLQLVGVLLLPFRFLRWLTSSGAARAG